MDRTVETDPQLPFGLLISAPDSGLWLATIAPDQLISMYPIATGGAA